MTKFNDLFAAIVAPAINDGPGGRGEEVVYLPHNKPERRAITVRINRNRAERNDQGVMVPMLTFTVIDSSTTGISRSEVSIGRDQILLKIEPNGESERRTVGAIVEESGGELEFMVG